MINLENISLIYDEQIILDDINLRVENQSTLALIGPSGCGKSSILNILAGVNHNFIGTATINGNHINQKSQTIGYIPQNYGLLPWLTVKENILLGLKIKHSSQNLPLDLIDEVGLTPYLNRYPKELSGGQQQRVSLLRAFSLNADILLMDEPFSALDTITREDMQRVFMQLWQQSKPTTLLVTHFVEEALYLGKYIAIMTKTPSKIYKIISNPLFGNPNFRQHKDFLQLADNLRQDLQKVIKSP